MTARYRAGKRLWDPADDEHLRREYPDTPTTVLATRLGRTVQAVYVRAQTVLGLRKSEVYLASPAACRLRRGDGVGAATRFQKGVAPVNKGIRGRKGWAPGRMAKGQFRKGERRGVAVTLYQPIGTERISKDGYLERKVNDDLPLQRRWRFVHLVLWEAAHGPVPKGYAVTFVNGDKRDVRLDNLALVSRADLMRRNTLHRLPPSLVQVIQLLGAAKRQIRRRDDASHDR